MTPTTTPEPVAGTDPPLAHGGAVSGRDAPRPGIEPGAATAVGTLSRLADYYSLTKPRITLLNLVTTFAAAWVASQGRPPLALLLATLFGTALAVASGGTLNCWAERDRDRLMRRTQRRPLPAGRVNAGSALLFGLTLGAAGVIVLLVWVNALSALIALTGIVFYVGVYTLLLKGRTSWNTVVGGIAGSVPPLIGWSAVTGQVDLAGLTIAGIVFMWQPVHFWALALCYTDDYRRAGIKMLPVTHGVSVTRRQIVLYTFLLVLTSAAAYGLRLAGVYYLAVALLAGLALLVLAVRNLRAPAGDLEPAWRLFHGSNAYLALLFLFLVLDCRSG